MVSIVANLTITEVEGHYPNYGAIQKRGTEPKEKSRGGGKTRPCPIATLLLHHGPLLASIWCYRPTPPVSGGPQAIPPRTSNTPPLWAVRCTGLLWQGWDMARPAPHSPSHAVSP